MRRELDEVVAILHEKGRAATYGAVAGIVGGPPQFVMQRRPRNPLNSWVVDAITNRPTGYEPAQIDARIQSSVDTYGVLDKPAALDEWLSQQ